MRYRISNRSKFNRFLILSFILFTILTYTFVAFRSGIAEGKQDKKTITIVVKTGDTLWSIASSLSPSQDPRKVIYDIMKLNGLSSDYISTGDRLILPSYWFSSDLFRVKY